MKETSQSEVDSVGMMANCYRDLTVAFLEKFKRPELVSGAVVFFVVNYIPKEMMDVAYSAHELTRDGMSDKRD